MCLRKPAALKLLSGDGVPTQTYKYEVKYTEIKLACGLGEPSDGLHEKKNWKGDKVVTGQRLCSKRF